MYVCIYVCMYVSMYLCIYVFMYLCIYVSMYLCIYLSIYVCMCVCVYVCMCVCMYVSMYVCMYVCICIYVCMYICIYVYMYICEIHSCSNLALTCNLTCNMSACHRPLEHRAQAIAVGSGRGYSVDRDCCSHKSVRRSGASWLIWRGPFDYLFLQGEHPF